MMQPHFFRTLVILALLLGSSSTAASRVPSAAGALIDGTSARPLDGLVNAPNFQISPNSQYIAYLSDKDANNVPELYTVSTARGSPIQLSPFITQELGVIEFQISPDSQRVVYKANQDMVDRYDLYSVLATGGPPIKLNVPLSSGEQVYQFIISPDSQHVIFVADRSGGGSDIYNVPLAGGTPVQLNAPLKSGSGLEADWFQISSDSQHVVYRMWNNLAPPATELYSVAITGGPSNRLTPGGGGGNWWTISVDGQRVIFLDNQANLYSIPIGGRAPTKLNPASIQVGTFEVSTDSRYVAYTALNPGSSTLPDLLSVPIIGGSSIRLSEPSGRGSYGGYGLYKISPNSESVLYTSRSDAMGQVELYSVPITGGTPTQLTPSPTRKVDRFKSFDFVFSPDSQRVVYLSDQEPPGVDQLYSVPISGGAPTKLNAPPANVFTFLVSADSHWVIYTAFGDEAPQMYSVPLLGGTVLRLSSPPLLIIGTGYVQISPDSQHVIYIGDQGGTPTLFAAQLRRYYVFLTAVRTS